MWRGWRISFMRPRSSSTASSTWALRLHTTSILGYSGFAHNIIEAINTSLAEHTATLHLQGSQYKIVRCSWTLSSQMCLTLSPPNSWSAPTMPVRAYKTIFCHLETTTTSVSCGICFPSVPLWCDKPGQWVQHTEESSSFSSDCIVVPGSMQ